MFVGARHQFYGGSVYILRPWDSSSSSCWSCFLSKGSRCHRW